MNCVRGNYMILAVLLLIFLSSELHGAPQRPGGRDPINDSGSKETTRRTTKRDPPKPRLADLTIVLSVDCHLFINGQAIEYRRTRMDLVIRSQKVRLEYLQASRRVTLKGLKPDLYVVSASSSDYKDFTESIDVSAATTNLVTINLQLKPGILTVSPGLNGAQIMVTSLSTGAEFGPYANQLNAAEIVPGPYRLNVSKDGYYARFLDLWIRPGETVRLEPRLDPKPVPTPTPTPSPKPPVVPVVPQSVSVERSGKYIVFHITGASGNASQTLGSINTDFNPTSGATAVAGVLPGVASRVSFVKLENVAEGSLIETPAPSNRWSLIVIRIKPKDSKRVVRFAINWISVSPPVP